MHRFTALSPRQPSTCTPSPDARDPSLPTPRRMNTTETSNDQTIRRVEDQSSATRPGKKSCREDEIVLRPNTFWGRSFLGQSFFGCISSQSQDAREWCRSSFREGSSLGCSPWPVLCAHPRMWCLELDRKEVWLACLTWNSPHHLSPLRGGASEHPSVVQQVGQSFEFSGSLSLHCLYILYKARGSI